MGAAKDFSIGYPRDECRRDTKNLAQAAVLKAVQSCAFGCRKTQTTETVQEFGLDERSEDVEFAVVRQRGMLPDLLQCHKISFCHTDTTTKLVPR